MCKIYFFLQTPGPGREFKPSATLAKATEMCTSQAGDILWTSTSVLDTPMTTSAPYVPAELTDIVVDLLHDDEESLATCALVCKGWLPAARYHLFRELLLHPWNF